MRKETIPDQRQQPQTHENSALRRPPAQLPSSVSGAIPAQALTRLSPTNTTRSSQASSQQIPAITPRIQQPSTEPQTRLRVPPPRARTRSRQGVIMSGLLRQVSELRATIVEKLARFESEMASIFGHTEFMLDAHEVAIRRLENEMAGVRGELARSIVQQQQIRREFDEVRRLVCKSLLRIIFRHDLRRRSRNHC